MLFFLLGVVQGTVATLEIIYSAERKWTAAIITTAISSLLAYVQFVWIVEDPNRTKLLLPWVAGDVVAVILGLWIRSKIGSSD